MIRKVFRFVLGVTLFFTALIANEVFGNNVADKKGGVGSDTAFVDVLDAPAAKNLLASRSLLNGITSAGKRLVTVGQSGHIIYSDDHGKSWTQASVPVSSDLVAVSFPASQKGWAVGHDGVILHSSDSGVTWVKQFDGRDAIREMSSRYAGDTASGVAEDVSRLVSQGPDKPFLDVWFDSETTGYVVGAFNLIFRTTDGGKVWKPLFERVENPKRLHLYGIKRIGQDLFVVGEQGLILKYDARSERFRSLKCQYNGTFFGLTGKPGVVIAFGLRGNVFRSLNEGIDWQKIETGVSDSLTGATVTSNGRIVLVTLLGNILASDDNGVTFKRLTHEQTMPAAAVTESDAGNLALVGARGVWAQAKK